MLPTHARLWLFALATAVAGCDDLSAGQPSEPDGPPHLARITVQDARGLGSSASPAVGFPQRGSVIDLLDDAPPPACSDTEPCAGQFLINQTSPDVSCSVSAPGAVGSCHDPLHVPASGVPLSVPLGVSGDAGSGMQLRVVFDKLLDDAIETVTVDPTQPPGRTNQYTLRDGLVALFDPGGAEVPSVKLYDNGGSPALSSDLLLSPFGPALVLKPKSPLAPATSYTLELASPSSLVDRRGQPAVDAAGAPLPTPYRVSFTTEPLTLDADASFPDFSQTPTRIQPSQIAQLVFWEPVDEATARVMLTGPGASTSVAVFTDRGADPTACAGNANPWRLDLVHVDGSGAPSPWPVGSYTLSLQVTDGVRGASTYQSGTLAFTVDAAAKPNDAYDAAQHLLPSQCTP